MASPELAIAKASFSAVLFRPDPTSCSRDDIEQFHALLAAVISHCSPANVQKCKRWALRNLVQSPTRLTALGKYLAALTSSFKAEEKGSPPAFTASKQRRGTSIRRKRLHILYFLNDVFFHAKVRDHNDTLASHLESSLPPLFRAAASFSNAPKQIRKLDSLIAIWEEKQYFPPTFTSKLRAALQGDSGNSNDIQDSATTAKTNAASKSREAPFIMPASHGDPSTPWHDLPAGNWLPVIEPNSTRPMNPSMIRPLQLAQGPAEKGLVDEVQKLLVHVERIYAKDARLDDNVSITIDQMGERVELDEITGDILAGDTYYGWSRAFCDKMKARRRKGGDSGRQDMPGRMRASQSTSRSRSPSQSGRSRSRSSSRPAFKRRRVSPPRSRSRSISPMRSSGRSQSITRRRSNSRDGYRRDPRSRSPRSDSRSRSRGSYSPPNRGRYSRRDGYDREQARSPRYSPPPAETSRDNRFSGGFQPPPHAAVPQPPFHIAPPANHQPQFHPVPPVNHQAPFNTFPVPPPPPPNYQGQWPPPPPPLPINQAQGWFSQSPQASGWSGGWVNPPPPPLGPPPPQQFGRGGNGKYNGQRGNWGGQSRGRGW